jgi:hypothetical protein
VTEVRVTPGSTNARSPLLLAGLGVTALWMLVVTGFLVRAMSYELGQLVVMALGLGFLAWNLSPPLLMLWLLRRFRSSAWAVGVLTGGSSLCLAGATTTLYSAFVSHPDPQSGLVMVFLPLPELLITGVAGAAAWLLWQRAR